MYSYIERSVKILIKTRIYDQNYIHIRVVFYNPFSLLSLICPNCWGNEVVSSWVPVFLSCSLFTNVHVTWFFPDYLSCCQLTLSSLYLDPQLNAWSPWYAAIQSDASYFLVVAQLSQRSYCITKKLLYKLLWLRVYELCVEPFCLGLNSNPIIFQLCEFGQVI